MMSAKATLFDYLTGLTDFERDFMRSIFPFYTWSRFNVPLQLQSIISNPRPYIRLANLLNVAQDRQTAQQLNGVPLDDWMAKNWPLPVGTNEQGQPVVKLLGSYLPAADLQYALRPGTLADKALNDLNVFLKRPVEIAFNYDTFRQGPIKSPENPEEVTKFMGMVEMDPRTAFALRALPPLQWLDSALQPDNYNQLDRTTQKAVTRAAKAMFGASTYAVDPSVQYSKENARLQRQYQKLKEYANKQDWVNYDRLVAYIERTYYNAGE